VVTWSMEQFGFRGDELASAGQLLGAGGAPIGEQAVVPDAMEAFGQHVHEEPTNELARLQRLPRKRFPWHTGD
jgi:hypothetical protein